MAGVPPGRGGHGPPGGNPPWGHGAWTFRPASPMLGMVSPTPGSPPVYMQCPRPRWASPGPPPHYHPMQVSHYFLQLCG